MALIQISDLTFSHEGRAEVLFDHLTLQLDTRWRIGLIGRNGRGKSTLLQLLQGRWPYQGQISAPTDFIRFPFPVSRPDGPAAEVVREAAPEAEDWQIERELSLLALAPGTMEAPFSRLSQGEQTKVLLAVLFLQEGRFPLIDEPTNHLDQAGRAVLGRYLRGKKGFLLVSHDRALLDDCVTHILALNRSDVQLRRGSYSDWQREQEVRQEAELASDERLRTEIRRLSDTARQVSVWSSQAERKKYGKNSAGLHPDKGYLSHKAAKTMRRAKAVERRRQELIGQKSALLQNRERTPPLRLEPLACPSEILLEAHGLSLAYGVRTVWSDLSFTLRRGQRLALQGKNGCGKSSLLRVLAGELTPSGGTLRLAGGLILSCVLQSAAGLRGGLYDFARASEVDATRLLTLLRKFGFARDRFDVPLETYSDGERKKVLLARSLCQHAHLYLWDEPLNYIDLPSRLQIEALLREAQPAMIFVEHDRAFAASVATDVLSL